MKKTMNNIEKYSISNKIISVYWCVPNSTFFFVQVRVYFDFANTEPNNRPCRWNAASQLGLLNSVYAVQKKYREKLK